MTKEGIYSRHDDFGGWRFKIARMLFDHDLVELAKEAAKHVEIDWDVKFGSSLEEIRELITRAYIVGLLQAASELELLIDHKGNVEASIEVDFIEITRTNVRVSIQPEEDDDYLDIKGPLHVKLQRAYS